MKQKRTALISWYSLLAVILICSSCTSQTTLDINLRPGLNLAQYKTIYTEVICEGSRFGPATDHEQLLWKMLRNMGFDIHHKLREGATDLILNCNIDYGWGVPKLIRHFNVEFRFPTKFNLEFIDTRTKDVLIKIAYLRGFADEPYKDLDIILTELKKRLIAAGSWTEPKK